LARKPTRGQVGRPAATLQVGDDLLDHGVATVVGFEVEQRPVAVGSIARRTLGSSAP